MDRPFLLSGKAVGGQTISWCSGEGGYVKVPVKKNPAYAGAQYIVTSTQVALILIASTMFAAHTGDVVHASLEAWP
jgi:hypothetical protein